MFPPLAPQCSKFDCSTHARSSPAPPEERERRGGGGAPPRLGFKQSKINLAHGVLKYTFQDNSPPRVNQGLESKGRVLPGGGEGRAAATASGALIPRVFFFFFYSLISHIPPGELFAQSPRARTHDCRALFAVGSGENTASSAFGCFGHPISQSHPPPFFFFFFFFPAVIGPSSCSKSTLLKTILQCGSRSRRRTDFLERAQSGGGGLLAVGDRLLMPHSASPSDEQPSAECVVIPPNAASRDSRLIRRRLRKRILGSLHEGTLGIAGG